jgi:UDP-N-acetyl-D-galactosamine dehydrogenase
MNAQLEIAVVGLGYVGLPLAVALSRPYKIVGYDIDPKRIQDLMNGTDRTDTVTAEELRTSRIKFSTNADVISGVDVVIVSVPTPVTQDKLPDLGPIRRASAAVGTHIKRGAIVVYESTVYPGVTEDICAPILEKHSGMKLGDGFALGYSPERINPGDSSHSIRDLVKIVSASDQMALKTLSEIYGSVSDVGVHQAPNIRVAEAAKVIENVQRDVNIALVNELSMLFHRMDIDTQAVLEAAGTKWNFER